MSSLWVVGGILRPKTFYETESHTYKSAAVLRVHDDGRIEKAFEYVTPPENRPKKLGILFKAATFLKDRVYLCTQTEILVCRLPDFKIQQVISLPCFNDVHHVTVGPNGNLFVAVTGLDAVAEISPEGELIQLTNVLGEDVWERFSKDVDYRLVECTKPHLSHPNYVFFKNEELWVTRFHQRDAVALHRPHDASISLTDVPVHDGLVHENKVHFTSVDGRIIEHSIDSNTTEVFDLRRFNPDPTRELGWCRGIRPNNDGTTWVGFSRLRESKIRSNLSWVKNGFSDTSQYPSRISRYSADKSAHLEDIVLEESGLGVVFSIHPVDTTLKA